GVGMAIVANRWAGVRAAVVYSVKQARHSRADNDSNVLALGSDFISKWQLARIVKAWLTTPFSTAKRHRRRVAKIDH
ncbi:MAG: RpiB/LacA/LacB family sugar-phosphate isomerase, partial [bacterium]|nr:RpiB/LacA/LacB family sugar-phosphate isomerase [bacterium]